MKAYRDPFSGGRLSFKETKEHFVELTIPCGQCIGCRLNYAGDWAVRIMHESQSHLTSLFVTLTQDDEHLRYNEFGIATLCKEDVQKFIRHMRKVLKIKIRYYAVGEYGDTTGRPHYHIILFGVFFKDRKFYKTSKGHTLWTSEQLNELWGRGQCYIGDLTFESASYCARYVMKKLKGKQAAIYAYEKITPEFALMSRNPGIGSSWFDHYGKTVYPSDTIEIRGKTRPPPRFYDKKVEALKPSLYSYVKQNRDYRNYLQSLKPQPSLQSKMEVKLAQLKMLLRGLE